MKIITSNLDQQNYSTSRPLNFEDFIWQEHIKKVLKSAIISAKKRNDTLWHILFSWDSWFWKTTLANIIANQLWKKINIITAYAIEKPSDMISILNQLENWDILFIDEIHRLKPKIEEILYIAMEDFRIDIIVQDENMSLPINKFTLIWATNRLEKLSDAFKNRFIYKFHLQWYSDRQIQDILNKYFNKLWIICWKKSIEILARKCIPVPREIKNLAIKVRDYIIAKNKKLIIDEKIVKIIINELQLENYWLSNLQKKYLNILKEHKQIWLKTISTILNVDEKVIEKDIEPLLINLEIIEKTPRWRKLLKKII